MLVGVIVSNLFNSFLFGVPNYKLYIVGGNAVNTDKGKTDFAYDFRQIAKKWKDDELKIDGKSITAEYQPDRWDENVASEKAEEIAASKDAIMVIGHFASTNTRKALYHYLSEEPPIPVLLTTETTPNLIPERLNKISEDLPFFRLWPTDATQAKSIAEFAAAGNKSFWVVEDRWANQVYSHYLAKNIVSELQRINGKNVILWSHNQNLLSSNTFKDLEIDSIIFAGVASNALIFINQIEKIWKSCTENGCQKPQIFLTDAAVDKNVLIKGMEAFEGKFITHPDLIACKKIDNSNTKSSLGNTTVLANDTKEIVKEIIRRADKEIKLPLFRQILGIHSVTDVRRAIATVMYQSKQNDETTFGPSNENNVDKYQFDKDGINVRANFRLWKVENHMFVEYKKQGGGLEPVSNCPN
jgi:hypothetical protein